MTKRKSGTTPAGGAPSATTTTQKRHRVASLETLIARVAQHQHALREAEEALEAKLSQLGLAMQPSQVNIASLLGKQVPASPEMLDEIKSYVERDDDEVEQRVADSGV